MKKPLSVRQLLLVGFLLTAMLPIIIFMLLAFYQARGALQVVIKDNLEIRATLAHAQINQMVNERLQNISSWATLEIVQELEIDDVDKRLSQFLSELKHNYNHVYSALYASDINGIIISSNDHASIGKPIQTFKPWLSITFLGREIQLFNIENNVMPISVNIINRDGQWIGQLWALFNWDNITQVLNNTSTENGAAALLVTNSQMTHSEVLTSTTQWQAIINTNEVKAYSNLNATDLNQNLSKALPWHVAVSEYRKVAMAPVTHMAYIFIGLLILTILFAFAIARPLARSMTQPLATLTHYAERFMRSSQSTLPPVDGPHEVRAMSKAFGKMMDELATSKEHLTRAAKLAVAGEMAAAMSHEVRTPLGILRSSAQLLSREQQLSDEAREVIGFIASETERLNKLVSTLVDSARPRAPEFGQHDVLALINHAVAMLRMQASKKNIDIVVHAGLDATANHTASTCMLMCDGEQITQVILNLVLNAIQVLPTGGKIAVRLIDETETLTISVADNGPDVSEAEKLHIFDPFFTKRPGGIGLGLAVSQQIVMAHHGQLKVQQSHFEDLLTGQAIGADFRVQLPKSQLDI